MHVCVSTCPLNQTIPTCGCVLAHTENPKIWTECGHHFHMPCIYEVSKGVVTHAQRLGSVSVGQLLHTPLLPFAKASSFVAEPCEGPLLPVHMITGLWMLIPACLRCLCYSGWSARTRALSASPR